MAHHPGLVAQIIACKRDCIKFFTKETLKKIVSQGADNMEKGVRILRNTKNEELNIEGLKYFSPVCRI